MMPVNTTSQNARTEPLSYTLAKTAFVVSEAIDKGPQTIPYAIRAFETGEIIRYSTPEAPYMI